MPVRIAGSGYGDLASGIKAAYSGDEIACQALTFEGDVHLQEAKTIRLNGGWNCDYTERVEETTLKGKLSINEGTLIIENLTLAAPH